jgi:serine/threonine protein kinase
LETRRDAESGDPERSAVLGRTIAGKFLIESYLGGGAMGAVYRARQIALEKNVAIKVLHGQHNADPMFAARFEREARAASKLDHPNSVRIIDFGQEPDGLLYIAMEFLDGRDLFDVIIDDWPLSTPRVADIVSQALAAVAVAHDMGVVHRDLKPENIMVQRGRDDEGNARDVVKVCDFGIAKFTDLRDESPAEREQKITTQGIIVGTPEYMSPEQARGEALDARSDVYALGVILYQMLTGRAPFDSDTALGIVLKHLTESAVPPRVVNPDVDERLEAICVKAMRKKREERYQSARDMRADLKALLGSAGPAALSSSKLLPQNDPHGSTAVAMDSASVAAAAVRAAAATKDDMTPAGGASLPAYPQASRGRGWLVGLAAVVVAGGGTAVWMMRSLVSAPAAAAEFRRPAALPTTSIEPVHASAAELPLPESTRVSSVRSVTQPRAWPAALAPKPVATAVAVQVPAYSVVPPEPPTATQVALALAPTAPAAVMTAAPPPSAALPPPVRAGFDASHAHVDWSVISAGGGATAGAVQRALSRKAGGWTLCYRSALERRNERMDGAGVLHLTTDESGNVVGAQIHGFDAMPGVKTCIVGQAGVHVANVDTGDAWADVQLTFRAE